MVALIACIFFKFQFRKAKSNKGKMRVYNKDPNAQRKQKKKNIMKLCLVILPVHRFPYSFMYNDINR